MVRLDSTEYEYYLAVKELKNSELPDEYKALLEARRRGADRICNIQERFNLLNQVAESRGINLKAELYPAKTPEQAKNEITKEVEMIKSPKSTSVSEFGYDFLNRILYIQYKSGEKVYPYINIPEHVFEEIKAGYAKDGKIGKIIANKVRGKTYPSENKIAGRV